MLNIKQKHLFERSIFESNNWIMFLFIAGLYLLTIFYSNHFIFTNSLYYASYNNIPVHNITQVLTFQNKWKWMGFVFVLLMLFVRINFTSACIAIGCYLLDFRISFSNLFRIVLVAEICLAFGMVVRIIWLTFTPPNTLADIQYFSPLSLAQILGPQNIPKYLIYLCQTINIFEIAYWLVLAVGLVVFLEKPFGKMFKLVMSSYGVGLLLWIVFVSYLTVTLAP